MGKNYPNQIENGFYEVAIRTGARLYKVYREL